MSNFSCSDLPNEKFHKIADACYQDLLEKTSDMTAPEIHSVLSYMTIKLCLTWKVPPVVLAVTFRDVVNTYKMLFQKMMEKEDAGS